MSLALDLLEQARQLATHDRRRPKQANLRRAISSAYYAVFHLLVDSSAKRMARDGASRRIIHRSFEHKAMKECALELAPPRQKNYDGTEKEGPPPGPSRKVRAYFSTLPADLHIVAEGFVQLQQKRHLADYDPDYAPDRAEALKTVLTAQKIFAAWKAADHSDRTETERFLTLLLLYKQLKD